MAPVYEKLGYKSSKHQQIFYEGQMKLLSEYQVPEDVKINTITEEVMDDIVAYEHSISFLDRSTIMKQMMQSKDPLCLKYATVNGKITGFLVVDKDYSGKKILSSFQSDSYNIAKALLYDVVKNDIAEESVVIVSLPGQNRETCVKLYAEFGLCKQMACYQGMFSHFDMQADWPRVFASFPYDISFVWAVNVTTLW